MEYERAKRISEETNSVSPNFFDEKMEQARVVTHDSRQKIFSNMVEKRLKDKEQVNNLKSSLYT